MNKIYIFVKKDLQFISNCIYLYCDDKLYITQKHALSLYKHANDKHLRTRESNRTSRICAWTNCFRTMLEVLKMIQFKDSSEWPRNQWRWWFYHWIQQLRNRIRYERENSNNQTVFWLRIQCCFKISEKRWWSFTRFPCKSRRLEREASKHNLLWNKIVFYFIIIYPNEKHYQQTKRTLIR